jgi:hypothetical protein
LAFESFSGCQTKKASQALIFNGLRGFFSYLLQGEAAFHFYAVFYCSGVTDGMITV